MCSGVSASPRRASLRPAALRLVLPASCDAVAMDSTAEKRCSRSRYSICAQSEGVGAALHGLRPARAPSTPRTAALAGEAIGAELPRSGGYQSFPGVTSYALPVTDEILPRTGHPRPRAGHVSEPNLPGVDFYKQQNPFVSMHTTN